MTRDKEQLVLERVSQLSAERLQEVLDFIEFLQQRDRRQRWVDFDEWAMNLAKERSFHHLTEEDVAQIVEAHRRQGRS